MTDEYNEEVEHIVKCNGCLSRDIINDHDKGEIYCGACGLVLQDEMLEESHHGRERGGDITSTQTHERNKESYTLGSVIGDRNVDFDQSIEAGLSPDNVILVEYGFGYYPEDMSNFKQTVRVEKPEDLLEAIGKIDS